MQVEKREKSEEWKTRNSASCYKRSTSFNLLLVFLAFHHSSHFLPLRFFTDPKFRHSSFSALCIPPCPPYPMQFENHFDDAIKTLRIVSFKIKPSDPVL